MSVCEHGQKIPPSPSKRGWYLNMYGPWDSQACSAMMKARFYCIKISSMPTAILVVYTSDGFVAVSDGKGNNPGNPSLHEQKIFNLENHSLHLMYGVSGAASVIDKDGKTDILKQAYKPILEELAGEEFSTLAKYADGVVDAIGPVIHEIFKEVALLKDWEQYPNEPYNFGIMFAGYFKGTPAIAERKISFWRDKRCITETKDFCPARHGHYILVGSDPMADIVSGAGNQFLQYKTPGLTKLKKNDGSISQKEAIDAGREYIKACMTPEARNIDPCVCESIGGDIWKATLGENGDFDVSVLVPSNGSV
jgi:hypothetical protein